jgi:hypothetical protein
MKVEPATGQDLSPAASVRITRKFGALVQSALAAAARKDSPFGATT